MLAKNDRNKGKIWMDFVVSELPDTPIFRFGATVDRDTKNKQNSQVKDHVIIVPHINFSGEDWHHVAGTWKNLNSKGNEGVLQLYFDGILVGEIRDFNHRLEWNIDEWEIRIGLGYKGKIDDFFILNGYLSKEEIAEIYSSEISIGALFGLQE